MEMRQDYELLERQFGEWAGVENTVACSSGTSALHLALESFRLPSGTGVIVPEYTQIACARAVTMAGLRPIFVDCNDSLLLDVRQLPEEDSVAGSRVIMPVHIYGRRCDMEQIVRYARSRGMLVVEDLAEAHGISPHQLSDAACWSFYSNKIIHGEEGGLVSFHEPELAKVAKQLRNLGHFPQEDFTYRPRGVNARLSNSHARLILTSLARADEALESRAVVAAVYDREIPRELHGPPREVNWVYDVRLPVGACMDRTVRRLRERGIPARHGFKPISSQREYYGPYAHLNAYRMSREVMYLPIRPDMDESEAVRIAKEFLHALKS